MTGWTLAGGRPAAAMASRRGGERHRPLWLAAGALAVTLLLLTAIQLGNSVTELRREIQDLSLQQENLVARHAALSLQWNRATSRQVVMTRAAGELGLVSPDDPGILMITRHEPARGDGSGDWRRRLHLDDAVPTALAGAVRP